MITNLAIFQTIIFLLYVGMVVARYGVIHSISQSWYELPRTDRWMFTTFLWLLSISTAMYGGPLFFISAVGFGFVGAATMFNSDTTTKLTHYAGAGIGILFAFLGLTFTFNLPIFIGIYAASLIGMVFAKVRHVIWWIEVVAFLILMIGFFSI